MGVERDRVAGFGRLEDGLRQPGTEWYRWGPYVSERQWGTVREDYSADGNAWDYLPHDHARSQAYRWGEDGLAGFCDIEQRLCLSLALWNGRDPILKERAFGLTGPQGNHGEDVKEYWWYLDAVPSHAWNRWCYHYPQGAFPYQDLIDVNAGRSRYQPEYELLDTGAFNDDRYWITEVHYAKAGPDDLLMAIQVTNAGPEAETLHVLPTAWFRNTWSWDAEATAPRPALRASGDGSVIIDHPFLGALELIAAAAPGGADPQLLFCENETNLARLYGAEPVTPYPKDGINDHVIHGAATVNPAGAGTKCAFWYQVTVPSGQTAELRLRLRPAPADGRGTSAAGAAVALGDDFDQVMTQRKAEADEFYAELTPAGASADEALVLRQASAGMLWSKQLFYYDVARWLDGDPTQPTPPEVRKSGRNAKWRNFDGFDIISMPDKWEYPWFAAWDLAFHTVPLAHLDPAFAKYQLILICREWFQNPTGALPAYEWDFGDVNPPVHAWAALQVFAIDGGRDLDFLSRVFDKLMFNFAWWVNQEDAGNKNVFQGGFLGLDNIGPIDRSHLPAGYTLEQSDATGWMGSYALAMGAIAAILTWSGQRQGQDLVLKFLEHTAGIRTALDAQGLWDDADGMFYDRLITPSGYAVPVKTRSMVSIIPALAAMVIDGATLQQAMTMNKTFTRFLQKEGVGDIQKLAQTPQMRGEGAGQRLLVSLARPAQLERLLAKLFDESEFLSPHGLRALSAYHLDHPYSFDAEGYQSSINYEPAESTTPMFGGNSNWRGPIWMPVNYLLIDALERYQRFYGDDLEIEYPTGSGKRLTLDLIIADLQDRLISLFTRDADGRRACFGGTERMQTDPAWKDNLIFSEYFHGDNGAAIGAFHQTGWTGLIADVILRRHGAVKSVGDVARDASRQAQQSKGVVAQRSGARASGRATARLTTEEYLSRVDRVARGKDARAVAPLESHGQFEPYTGRDPVGLLLQQEQSRVPELVPVRHGRMLVSAFTFYRGAALPMAADLATTPTSGLWVQLCGDAHLSNFGAFASPARRLVFDVNDFDETLPGPFEWDVKRMAASFAVAGRDSGFPAKTRRKIALAAAEGYRTAMRGFADQPLLQVWYAHLDIEQAIREFRSQIKAKKYKETEKALAKAHTRDSTQALGKLTTVVDGHRRIISDPPLIVPIDELYPDMEATAVNQQLREVLDKYRRTLQSDRRHLLEQFTMNQLARKVVGVGSVGTRAWILLMEAGDGAEPLFLQAKEAQTSVLADYCGRSEYANQGERVVAGQHLMQAQSDIFLGWTRVRGADKVERDFYVRQLRDWKFSMPIEQMLPAGMTVYARLCGWTLARAHACSGDRIALGAYLGGSTKFDQAIAEFAETYADQNERDYAALQTAVKEGRAESTTDI